jgi:hypothetical protein
MKSNLLRIFLEWALIASVIMSIGFFAWFFMSSHSARASENQIVNAQTRLQYNRQLVAALDSDCGVYGKTNVDFQHFLNSLNQPAAAPAQTPTRPATK